MQIEPFRTATPQTAGAVLGLLKAVMTAEGAAPLADVHQAVLRAVATHFFGGAVEPEPGGAAIPPPLRRGVAELAVLMPLADPVMDGRKVEAAARVVRALDQAVPQIEALRDAAAGRLQRLRLRVATPLVKQLAGVGVVGAVGAVLLGRLGTQRGHGRRIRAASDHAPGTLGREMLRYYADNPFAMPGDPGGMPPVLVGRHDFLHVMTGYDTSTEGELCLSGFVGACAGPVARMEALVVGLMQFNQAVPVQEFAAEVVTRGMLDPDTYVLSLARGAACTRDVADPGLQYLDWLDRDLIGLRRDYGIVGEAGMMVHAGQPVWAAPGPQKVLGGQRRRTGETA